MREKNDICQHSVGYSGSPSTVNETNCNKKKVTLNSFELHQFHPDESHHDVLDEGCHLLYGCGEIGSATCSPDRRWRRFFERETAARKSGRSRIGPFLPDLFKVRYHCPLYLLNSSVERWYVWFCLANFVHLFAIFLAPANFEVRFTINLISEKSIVNTCKMFTFRVNSLAASLPRIPSFMVLFLFFSFPYRAP